MNRKEAIEKGLITYPAERPCMHGNIADRHVSNGRCLCEPCRKRRSNRVLDWQKRNPEKQRALVDKWVHNNPGKVKFMRDRFKVENAARIKERRKLDAPIHRARCHHRRALKRNAVPKWFSDFDKFVVTEAADLCRRRRKATGIKWSIDHLIPLKAKNACGLHVGINIQVIPAKLNSAKQHRMIWTEPLEWLTVSFADACQAIITADRQ